MFWFLVIIDLRERQGVFPGALLLSTILTFIDVEKRVFGFDKMKVPLLHAKSTAFIE